MLLIWLCRMVFLNSVVIKVKSFKGGESGTSCKAKTYIINGRYKYFQCWTRAETTKQHNYTSQKSDLVSNIRKCSHVPVWWETFSSGGAGALWRCTPTETETHSENRLILIKQCKCHSCKVGHKSTRWASPSRREPTQSEAFVWPLSWFCTWHSADTSAGMLVLLQSGGCTAVCPYWKECPQFCLPGRRSPEFETWQRLL